jgi:hypothetical protein
MDGTTLLLALRETLNESATSDYLDERTSYEFLWEAACEVARRTKSITTTQSITTVEDQVAYNMNPDFLGFYLRNNDENYFIHYTDTALAKYPIIECEYEDVIIDDNSDSVDIPSRFALKDAPQIAAITGSCTSAGALANGLCSLKDSSAPFTNVKPGDIVYNTTDASTGLVVSITSASEVVTALFDGTDNDWDFSVTGDAYIILPQFRYSLVLDPPPSTAAETITVYYVKRPDPVFSARSRYPFQSQLTWPIARYAAWLYKYRDGEPQYGDALYVQFDNAVRVATQATRKNTNRRRLKVNMKRG